jgi:uncharacterized membrane protein YccC
MTKFFPNVGREALLFSVKTFIASMLALWLALRFDLQNPYWTMATVYIVANPLSGAATSKALYRMLGTIMGAVVTVLLVPPLVETPELLCLAFSLWVGGCIFISLHDRTPRSYVFLLGGYTVALIGFRSVSAPDLVFTTAVARVEEITLGILCSALVSRAFFPRHAGPVLAARIETWLDDARCWVVDVLAGRRDAAAAQQNLWCLATDTFAMLALTTHLAYDTSPLRYAANQMRALQQRMTALLPIMTGITDQLSALERAGGSRFDLPPLLADIAQWIASGKDGTEEFNERRLRLQIAHITRELESHAGRAWTWPDLLMLNLMARLRELVVVWTDCQTLRRDILSGSTHIPRRLRAVSVFSGESSLHRDRSTAVLSGCSATIATLISCAFWIATGWQDGAMAAMMCATLSALFASMDNPVPVLKQNVRIMLVCLVFSGIYMLAVLPLVQDFMGLLFVFAPFLLFFGIFIPSPKWGPLSVLSCLNLPIMLALQSRPVYNFALFLNSNIACIFGVMIAAACASVIRSIGVKQSIRRLLHTNRMDIAKLLEQRRTINSVAFMHRLVDRFGLVVQRVATLPDESWNDPTRILAELRIGLNIVDLQMLSTGLPLSQQREIAFLLQGLKAYFTSTAGRDADLEQKAMLLTLLDNALAILASPENSQPLGTRCLRALVGIRCGLLPASPNFIPLLPAMKQEAAA